MYSCEPLKRLIAEKEEEQKALENVISECKKLISEQKNGHKVSDKVYKKLAECRLKVKIRNSIIKNATEQINILETLEKDINSLEKTHTDIFKSTYDLLISKL